MNWSYTWHTDGVLNLCVSRRRRWDEVRWWLIGIVFHMCDAGWRGVGWWDGLSDVVVGTGWRNNENNIYYKETIPFDFIRVSKPVFTPVHYTLTLLWMGKHTFVSRCYHSLQSRCHPHGEQVVFIQHSPVLNTCRERRAQSEMLSTHSAVFLQCSLKKRFNRKHFGVDSSESDLGYSDGVDPQQQGVFIVTAQELDVVWLFLDARMLD